jgi:hypothetical protein
MAINKNHEFEDLNGVKCAIVERNVLPPREEFLRSLLSLNGYEVISAPSPPPKAVPAKSGEEIQSAEVVPSVTLGVTDVSFNAVNAIFGRALRTEEGRIVTLEYWLQKSKASRDDVPYFQAT